MGNRERKGILMNQESELEVFKRKIDLRQFAISLGYEMDRRESWRGRSSSSATAMAIMFSSR